MASILTGAALTKGFLSNYMYIIIIWLYDVMYSPNIKHSIYGYIYIYFVINPVKGYNLMLDMHHACPLFKT